MQGDLHHDPLTNTESNDLLWILPYFFYHIV